MSHTSSSVDGQWANVSSVHKLEECHFCTISAMTQDVMVVSKQVSQTQHSYYLSVLYLTTAVWTNS